jgi:phosphoribosylglycinamide formyltransferase-1
MEKPPLSLGFLASHNGTDMQAIVGEIEAGRLNAKAEIVISNNSESPALQFAREHNIDWKHISSKTHENPDEVITKTLLSHGVELVIFSGYMKVVNENSPLLQEFEGRIWNPHPADTVRYPAIWGDSVHEAVLSSGDKYTFPTIHIVNGTVDGGPILSQGKIKVESNDTVETLKPKVQKEEIRLFLDLLRTKTASES